MNIIILGNGAEVPNIIEVIDSYDQYQVAGILDDAPAHPDELILGPLAKAPEYSDCFFVCGIHSLQNRYSRLQLISGLGVDPERFISLIHPRATVSASAVIGRGTIVQAGTVINAHVHIGACCYISPNCVVGHDCSVGTGNIFGGGALLAGRIKSGAANYWGMGASVKENLNLGTGNIIGMGAALLNSISDGTTQVGVPAGELRKETPPEQLDQWVNFWNCN